MTANFLPQNAILELIFPDDLPISQLTLNSIIGIIKIQSNVNYTIDRQRIIMSNAIGAVYYTSSDIHFFRVSSIQNPVSDIR